MMFQQKKYSQYRYQVILVYVWFYCKKIKVVFPMRNVMLVLKRHTLFIFVSQNLIVFLCIHKRLIGTADIGFKVYVQKNGIIIRAFLYQYRNVFFTQRYGHQQLKQHASDIHSDTTYKQAVTICSPTKKYLCRERENSLGCEHSKCIEKLVFQLFIK